MLFSVVLIITSPKAEAVNFNCSKSDAGYAVTINVDPSAPAWLRGCYQRITVNEGFQGALSFMYLTPETIDLSSGDATATLHVLYYYRGVSGVEYAGMCSKVNSTSNSNGKTDVIDTGPDIFGFTFPCSGWLGHNSYRSFQKTVTVRASKFNEGSNQGVTFNYTIAFDFSHNSSGTNKSGIQCQDYYSKPYAGPLKSPPCIDTGSNGAFVNIIKSKLVIVKYPQNGATNNNLDACQMFILAKVNCTGNSNSKSIEISPGTWTVTGFPDSGYRVTRFRINRYGPGCGPCESNFYNTSSVEALVTTGGTTYVDVFYEPITHDSNLDTASCPRDVNGVKSPGIVGGWVQRFDRAGISSGSDVHIYFGKPAGTPGKQPDVVIPAKDLTKSASEKANGQPIYRFSYQIPTDYYDAKTHTVYVYSFDSRGSYQLNESPKQFTCPGPKGALDMRDNSSTTCGVNNGQGLIKGWGFDPQRPAEKPNLHFYFDSTPGNTTDPDAKYNRNNVVGTKLRPDVVASLRSQGYPGVQDSTPYGFEEPFPDGLHDGEPHVLRVYLITKSGSNPLLGSSVTNETTVINFVCEAWYYPWMQTQNGDVIASGKITGQVSGDDLLGSRPPNVSDKEAEYLVISIAGSGGPFCSTYQYILTNTSALSGNCGNGNGYNVLNKYELGGDPNNDAVYKAIETAYNSNGAGNISEGANTKCSPYNTFGGLTPTIDSAKGSAACINGTIFSISGSINELTVNSGRNTIFSGGDLLINGDIIYGTGTFTPPDAEKKVPNLAIIVKGDVRISTSVKRIDAAIYATGKVFTCDKAQPEQCREQLIVNGMLVGKNGFLFGRSFNDAARNPAELVTLTAQTVVFPPPGFDSRYFVNFDNSVQIDSGEFQPRFWDILH